MKKNILLIPTILIVTSLYGCANHKTQKSTTSSLQDIPVEEVNKSIPEKPPILIETPLNVF